MAMFTITRRKGRATEKERNKRKRARKRQKKEREKGKEETKKERGRKKEKEREGDFGAHLGEVFPHDLDEIGHGEVHDLVSPGQLQHHVRVQQVIGCEQAGGEALLLSLLQEPLEESLGQLCLL